MMKLIAVLLLCCYVVACAAGPVTDTNDQDAIDREELRLGQNPDNEESSPGVENPPKQFLAPALDVLDPVESVTAYLNQASKTAKPEDGITCYFLAIGC